MSNSEQRLSALSSLAQVMDETARPALAQHLLDATQDLSFEYKRARAISDIAPLVAQEMITTLLRLAQEIEDPMDRIAALSALIPRLPLDQRRTVTVQCWHLIAEIDNGYDAASALVILAPLLPENAAKDLARRASMIIGSIMDDYDQASAITILAPLIAVPGQNAQDRLPDKYAALEKALLAIFAVDNLEQRLHLLKQGADLWTDISESDQSYPLWQNVAQRLSTMPQADTLLALAALRPVIRFLGGSDAVREVAGIFETNLTKAVAESD
jgi:hypothetical protein